MRRRGHRVPSYATRDPGDAAAPPRGGWGTETVYAITDLDWREVTAARLAEMIRGHRGIENRLHRRRPAVMATLRNLAVSLHRPHIAAACRHVSRHPHRVLAPLT
jgi:hypothetical protein